MTLCFVFHNVRILQQLKSLAGWFVLLSLLLIALDGAHSFSFRRGPRLLCALPSSSSSSSSRQAADTRCHQHPGQAKVQLCRRELQRLRHLQRRPTILSTTSLSDSIEQEIETPMKINGDIHGFLSHRGESRSSSGSAHAVQDGTVFKLNGSSTQHSNGHANGINGSSSKIDPLPPVSLAELDVPIPTANGGFSHTVASKAKIGAANKGKTPWNKGRQRSEEEKARIAAGVRARNREKFLEKLKDMGLTEEEYDAKKKEERRIKDAERRARRTEKGGYRPTEETKAKISRILKEKHAKGEIKPRTVDPTKVRRGFTHSDETKRKISESLRKRWSADSDYRERMTQSMKTTYSKEEIRKKVSRTLKKKWQDPEFREEMLQKMNKSRKSPNVTDDYRQKISKAMKAKWQDPEYREKTLNAIAKHNESLDSKPRVRKTSKPRGSAPPEVRVMKPLKPGEAVTKTKRVRKKKAKAVALKSANSAKAVPMKTVGKAATPEKKKQANKKAKEPDGSVNRLREERRDLFDLLYGDEPFDDDADNDIDREDLLDNDSLDRPASSRFGLGDEDLDSFDPYGLDDY